MRPAADNASLTIRGATPADLAVVAEFNALLAWESEHKRLDAEVLESGVRKALADPERLRYWVAEREGTVIGQSAVTREWSDWRDGWVWWFQSVYVREDERGRGVFRAIFRHIREAARAQADVIGLRLYVEQDNRAAHDVYAKLGMTPGGYHVYEELWLERFKRRNG